MGVVSQPEFLVPMIITLLGFGAGGFVNARTEVLVKYRNAGLLASTAPSDL